MALVTVQRSPSIGSSPPSSVSDPFCRLDSGAGASLDEEDSTKNGRSLSECYFAGKGAAVVLPAHHDRLQPSPTDPPISTSSSTSGSDIQHHLQSMFYLLKPEETLKMAVKLESVHPGRTRYLVVVSRPGRQLTEESCLLGIDCNHATTVGLVLKVLADTAITLDGDGGFSVSVCGRQHIFKPVSVQAMWSALQTLHKVSAKAREHNYFLGGLTHEWVAHYEGRISSDRSCLNEWHAMDSLESRRPPSPDSVRHKPTERSETERVIRTALKEIMMSVDLDEVTSKQVRAKLEECLDVDLGEFKSFIDEEMLVILGQMDEATEIFPHVYLGSEWNASNLEELNKNGVCHILNVTREIDNFFPGMFDYLNIRVYDDEKTDLLKHWDNTFKYISKAKNQGSKVLVHCKMGVSRSASVVIAYAMKAYSWDLKKALTYVQTKRQCIKPNSSFIAQLETYQGILDAMKNREKLQRSKSETNLKCSKTSRGETKESETTCARSVSEGESEVDVETERPTCEERLPPLHGLCRPKSWSPDHNTVSHLFSRRRHHRHHHNAGNAMAPMSIEQSPSDQEIRNELEPILLQPAPPPPPPPPPLPVPEARNYNINVRMPCGNGLAYSVSQNKILHLPCSQTQENGVSSVKHRVNALESQTNGPRRVDRRGLVLNLTSQFEEEKTEKRGKDVFSSQLDRVFDREECTNHEVSRQSSWSSLDSGMTAGEGVSRQSSWGSGDTRNMVPPSRNSSWGSYDLRPSISGSNVPVQQLQLPPPPPPSSTNTATTAAATTTEVGGKVKNLKREFEAKSSSTVGSNAGLTNCCNSVRGGVQDREDSETVHSLPSSPISDRCDIPSPSGSLEELSVRRLVGRYERPCATTVIANCPPPTVIAAPAITSTSALTISSIAATTIATTTILTTTTTTTSSSSSAAAVATATAATTVRTRPPLVPVVKAAVTTPRLVISNVLTKAAHKKQQQGKTHPLARLTKHTNPVYNTM
ncbi:protein phosphatase Slingshot isoform X3 [Rhodnius prolixus]|uniref:protein phosphatase Slingshot isoform X3 n=1 Tax=Rhodnius prolixus TaxID=13249 RepID=UPI003D18DCBA